MAAAHLREHEAKPASVSKLHSNSNVVCRLTKRLLEPGRCHFNFIFYSKLFEDEKWKSQCIKKRKEKKNPLKFTSVLEQTEPTTD